MLKARCVLIRRTVWHTFSEPTSCSWDKQMSRAQKVPANNSTLKKDWYREVHEKKNQSFYPLHHPYSSRHYSIHAKKCMKKKVFWSNTISWSHLFFRSRRCSGPPSGDPVGGLSTEVPEHSPFSSVASSQRPGNQWESLLRWEHRSQASWGTGNDSLVFVHMSALRKRRQS